MNSDDTSILNQTPNNVNNDGVIFNRDNSSSSSDQTINNINISVKNDGMNKTSGDVKKTKTCCGSWKTAVGVGLAFLGVIVLSGFICGWVYYRKASELSEHSATDSWESSDYSSSSSSDSENNDCDSIRLRPKPFRPKAYRP